MYVLLAMLAVVVVACTGSDEDQTPGADDSGLPSDVGAPAAGDSDAAPPEPGEEAPDDPSSSVGVSNPDDVGGDNGDFDTGAGTNEPSSFGPQGGDRRHASISSVELIVRESWPLQLALTVTGDLRDGCQDLAWDMTPSGTSYEVEVWEVQTDPDLMCTQALVPFSTQIELGTSETEDVSITVNGTAY